MDHFFILVNTCKRSEKQRWIQVKITVDEFLMQTEIYCLYDFEQATYHAGTGKEVLGKVESIRAPYWDYGGLSSSSMTYTVRSSAPAENLWMTPS